MLLPPGDTHGDHQCTARSTSRVSLIRSCLCVRCGSAIAFHHPFSSASGMERAGSYSRMEDAPAPATSLNWTVKPLRARRPDSAKEDGHARASTCTFVPFSQLPQPKRCVPHALYALVLLLAAWIDLRAQKRWWLHNHAGADLQSSKKKSRKRTKFNVPIRKVTDLILIATNICASTKKNYKFMQ